MNLDLENHAQAVRWPFFLGDAVLLLIALSIALFHPDPFSAAPLIAIILCVAVGAVLFAVPFLLEYTARQEDHVQRREEGSSDVARLINQAAETLTGSVSRLGTVEATLRETLRALENAGRELKRLQDADAQALREENAQLKEAAMEQFEASVVAAGRTAGRIEMALKEAGELLRATAKSTAPAPPNERSESKAVPSPVKPGQPKPIERPPEKKVSPLPKPNPAPAASVEDPLSEPLTSAAEATDEPAPEAATDPASDDNGEPTFSSDGVTRLLATAYIGIGNKLYVRGEGAGLNWERGQPLKFISIGKWSWEAPEEAGPVTVRLLKNDTEWAKNDPVTIQPGEQREIAVRL